VHLKAKENFFFKKIAFRQTKLDEKVTQIFKNYTEI